MPSKGRLKLDRPKTTRQMEVGLVKRCPRRPVGMRGFVPAFVQIGAPLLSLHLAKGAHPLFQDRQGNGKLQVPLGGFTLGVYLVTGSGGETGAVQI